MYINFRKTEEAIQKNWRHYINMGYTRHRTKTNKTKNTTQKHNQTCKPYDKPGTRRANLTINQEPDAQALR